MTYFKDENGFVYCYDDRTAVTMVYKYTKWKISKVTYYELKRKAGIEEITEREAKNLTNGAEMDDLMYYRNNDTFEL